MALQTAARTRLLPSFSPRAGASTRLRLSEARGTRKRIRVRAAVPIEERETLGTDESSGRPDRWLLLLRQALQESGRRRPSLMHRNGRDSLGHAMAGYRIERRAATPTGSVRWPLLVAASMVQCTAADG
jgi:hypothetical protein